MKIIGLGTLLLLGLFVLVMVLGDDPRDAGRGTPTTSAGVPCNKKSAEAKLEQARDAGVISGLDVRAGEGMVIIVHDDLWRQMPYTTKLGMTQVVQCAVLGPGEVFTEITVRSSMTNRVLGTRTWGGELEVR